MPDLNTPDSFDGWVMINEFTPGVLLLTDISAISSSPGLNAPTCPGDHSVDRDAAYELVNPEDVVYLCAPCVELLFSRREVGGYLMGVLPAN